MQPADEKAMDAEGETGLDTGDRDTGEHTYPHNANLI